MTKQFIAHADQPRTFADAKGAKKAIKRDLGKHWDAHGDVLYETGTEAKQTPNGRFGVVVFVDLTPEEAQRLVGPELEGYVIEPQLKSEPKPKATPAPKANAPKKSRRNGEINVEPQAPLVAARVGSKQQAIIDLLTKGCTLDDLREVCVKRDGTPWDDNSIRSALYYDVKFKGYGVRTEWDGDTPTYHIVLPEGYEAPLDAKPRKS